MSNKDGFDGKRTDHALPGTPDLRGIFPGLCQDPDVRALPLDIHPGEDMHSVAIGRLTNTELGVVWIEDDCSVLGAIEQALTGYCGALIARGFNLGDDLPSLAESDALAP